MVSQMQFYGSLKNIVCYVNEKIMNANNFQNPGITRFSSHNKIEKKLKSSATFD